MKPNTETKVEYLEGISHIRRRPAMYLGFTDHRALNHMVYMVLDNAVDEAVNGDCSRIELILRDNQEVVVRDNSAGLPVHLHPEKGVSYLELEMTAFGRGYRERANYYLTSILCGDLTCVNALSQKLTVEVSREGYLWRQTYVEGTAQTPVERVRPLYQGEPTGTTITFTPDFTIIEPNEFDYQVLANRCKHLASVVAGSEIVVCDERDSSDGKGERFYYQNGLYNLVLENNQNAVPLHPIVHAKEEITAKVGDRDVRMLIEIAFQFTKGADCQEITYCNTVLTPQNGTHLDGLRKGILKFINQDAKHYHNLNLSWRDIHDGFVAVVSVFHPEPRYDGRRTLKLINPELQDAVKMVTYTALLKQFSFSYDFTAPIIDRYIIDSSRK